MKELCFSPFPVLATTRLLLRKIDENDLNELLTLRSDQQVMQYIDRPLISSVDEALELFKKIDEALYSKEGITWGISLQEDHTLIGTIGYWRILKEHSRAEIGYLLATKQQGKGLMHEAMSKIIHFGFREMGLHSIEANVNPANTASIRLLEKNNFIQEAYFIENYFSNGQFKDSAIYSLLNNGE